MAKKQRRNQSRKPSARAVRPAATVPITEVGRVQEPRSMPVAAKPRAGTTWEEFAERYRYVNAELKQIGILAGSFLVVLLILQGVLG